MKTGEEAAVYHPPHVSWLLRAHAAYLIEEYAGALPTWMAPEQVRFLPVTDRAADYCGAGRKARAQGLPREVDNRNEKIGKKIRDAQMEKIPYMLVVGDRDMENGTVSRAPRRRRPGRHDAGGFLCQAAPDRG